MVRNQALLFLTIMLRSPCMFTVSITAVVSSLKTVSSLCLGSDTLPGSLALGNALLTVFMLWHLVLDHLSPCLSPLGLHYLTGLPLSRSLVRHPTLGYCGPISSAYGHLHNSFRTKLFKNKWKGEGAKKDFWLYFVLTKISYSLWPKWKCTTQIKI